MYDYGTSYDFISKLGYKLYQINLHLYSKVYITETAFNG